MIRNGKMLMLKSFVATVASPTRRKTGDNNYIIYNPTKSPEVIGRRILGTSWERFCKILVSNLGIHCQLDDDLNGTQSLPR